MKTNSRTSQTHPLQIAEVQTGEGSGRIGITFCPGKKNRRAMSGAWDRDLDTDLDRIAEWGAVAVVSLIQEHEMRNLQVVDLGTKVRARHMSWFHLPIRDVSAPDREWEEQWTNASGQLRGMLAAGFDILVHCKGGLGRAGLVSARLLVEMGEDPRVAIRQVRQVRPGAIETSEQERHVLAARPVSPVEPARTLEATRDRAMGAFLGLAVGDAIGTTLEFSARDSQPLLEDMVGGGPFRLKPGEWTDDTAMALALAYSLAECRELDPLDLVNRFLCWRDDGEYSCNGRCFDIGITTTRALSRFLERNNPLAGSDDPNSAGNGSLMRLAPVAVRYWHDAGQRREAAALQSRTTHAAREAVDACVGFSDMLGDTITGMSREQVLADREFDGAPAVAEVLGGSWRGKARKDIRSSGYVIHTLEAAIWCVARTGSFRDAVLLAANLGDDADTVAAVTGQLAGALHGMSGIPDAWLERLALTKRLQANAARLFGATVETSPRSSAGEREATRRLHE